MPDFRSSHVQEIEATSRRAKRQHQGSAMAKLPKFRAVKASATTSSMIVVMTIFASSTMLGLVAGFDLADFVDETGLFILQNKRQLLEMRGTDMKLTMFDSFIQDVIPVWLGQAASNINGTAFQYKDYALTDESNDDAAQMSKFDLIVRSGFKYEEYEAVADDGYITQLTRIINPLADRRYLRYPPVLIEHGGTIDPTAYLLASSIQHFPEKWPRAPSDGPYRSWNRSLAFLLANRGFDVWLAETRGANDGNRKHIRDRARESALEGRNLHKNMTTGEQKLEIDNSWNYWSFSQDDIIAHELKSHIDAVLQVTRAKKVHLFTFSLSTPTSLAFFSIRPDYAEKVEGYVSMAPIVSGQGVNSLIKLALQTVCPILPDALGTLLITNMLFSPVTRRFIVAAAKPRVWRYSFVKAIIQVLLGPSAKFRTHLDLNVLGHMLRSLSFKEAKQLCQQTKANKLQKFDYGKWKNKQIYGQEDPPVYDLSNLKIKDWIVVSASHDSLATPAVVQQLFDLVEPKPSTHIIAPGFNHLDLIAAFGVDTYVNLPILSYLERRSVTLNPREQESNNGLSSNGRTLDAEKFANIANSTSPGAASPGYPRKISTSETHQMTPVGDTGLFDIGGTFRNLATEQKKVVDNVARSVHQFFGRMGGVLNFPKPGLLFDAKAIPAKASYKESATENAASSVADTKTSAGVGARAASIKDAS